MVSEPLHDYGPPVVRFPLSGHPSFTFTLQMCNPERYPRDEDDDDASASASDIDDDEDSDDAASACAIKETSASHDCIRFGSFDSPIILVSTPSIEPKFDGFSVKIGDFSCALSEPCSKIEESLF
jgi:hypothetical protein